MQKLTRKIPGIVPTTGEWVQALNAVLAQTDQQSHSGNRASLSCRKVDGKPIMFVPGEMATLQPAVLEYLHALGAANEITLVEDRREVTIRPLRERRNRKPSKLALGVSLLLKQTGLPGPARGLSDPHILEAGNRRIDIARLINMTASVCDSSKKVVFTPNKFLVPGETGVITPMTGYACNIKTPREKFTLSYFNAPEFHALGYNAGSQFVLHVLLGGGSIRSPEVWSPFDTLAEGTFRCQVFKGKTPADLFGLLYSTFYIDMESSIQERLVTSRQTLSKAV